MTKYLAVCGQQLERIDTLVKAAGVSQELNVPVCVVEDQHQFVLHHRIMWQGGDVDHAVAVID